MMDCKKALEENGGDMAKAEDWLRKKGIMKAESRAARAAAEGAIQSYIHHNGSVGVLLEINCETDFVARTEDFQALVKDIAMHIAAADPLAVSVEDLPPEVVAREKAIFEAQVAESGKPENVRVKMIEGKLKKFYQERVLLEQAFVKDDKMTVGDLVKAASGKTGEKIAVKRFARFKLGGE
jgi:elongation factor Ts